MFRNFLILVVAVALMVAIANGQVITLTDSAVCADYAKIAKNNPNSWNAIGGTVVKDSTGKIIKITYNQTLLVKFNISANNNTFGVKHDISTVMNQLKTDKERSAYLIAMKAFPKDSTAIKLAKDLAEAGKPDKLLRIGEIAQSAINYTFGTLPAADAVFYPISPDTSAKK